MTLYQPETFLADGDLRYISVSAGSPSRYIGAPSGLLIGIFVAWKKMIG
jgi:hypothetical protein